MKRVAQFVMNQFNQVIILLRNAVINYVYTVINNAYYQEENVQINVVFVENKSSKKILQYITNT